MPTLQCQLGVNLPLGGAPSFRVRSPAESKGLRKHELEMKAFFVCT